MEYTITSKYGSPKPARYFVRSLEDFLDVCATVCKIVTQNTEPGDISEVLKSIGCSAIPLPNSVSSVILCFDVPRLLFDQKIHNRNPRPVTLNYEAEPKPAISYSANCTFITMNIETYYDLHLTHHFLLGLLQTRSEGMKLIAAKKAARLEIRKLENSSSGYNLIIVLPGLLFVQQFLGLNAKPKESGGTDEAS